MARLQLISDLHTEFSHYPVEFCQNLEIAPDLDFLVIAGDLFVPRRQHLQHLAGILDHFAKKARWVLYVEGNHEFYGSNREYIEKFLGDYLPGNYIWLRNNGIELEGKHFFGGAMWFGNEDGRNGLYRDQMNDWSQIKGFSGWVYEENAKFRLAAMEQVRPETIVITHYLPHSNSTPRMYKDSDLNRFFVSDMTPIIHSRRPRLWLHGHTHMPCDYQLEDTRVLCHPHGYPHERKWMGKYVGPLLEV